MRNQIVVGLDDSPSSEAVLQLAAEKAKSTGAVSRVVHALGRPHGFAAADIAPTSSRESLRSPRTPAKTRSPRCSRRVPASGLGA